MTRHIPEGDEGGEEVGKVGAIWEKMKGIMFKK